MTYSDAKKQIHKVGYANVTGDAKMLVCCECLDSFFQVRAMSRGMVKRIYSWAQKHHIDVREALEFAHKQDGMEWILWNAILDDKPITL